MTHQEKIIAYLKEKFEELAEINLETIFALTSDNIATLADETSLDAYFAQKAEEAKQAEIAAIQARLSNMDTEKAELQAKLDELNGVKP